MVGYSFEHGFNDTFTLRQNLRFAENKTAQNSVYGYGVPISSIQQWFTSPCAVFHSLNGVTH
jgi:iron complex outermembrane receptor protein